MSWLILSLKVIVGLGFAVSGAAKLKGTPALAAQFEEFGFPPAWMYAVGIVELVGVLGIFLWPHPVWACIGLVLLMVGAIVNHLKVGHPIAKSMPAIIMLFLTVLLGGLLSMQSGRI